MGGMALNDWLDETFNCYGLRFFSHAAELGKQGTEARILACWISAAGVTVSRRKRPQGPSA